jgi:hypothetical protein
MSQATTHQTWLDAIDWRSQPGFPKDFIATADMNTPHLIKTLHSSGEIAFT